MPAAASKEEMVAYIKSLSAGQAPEAQAAPAEGGLLAGLARVNPLIAAVREAKNIDPEAVARGGAQMATLGTADEAGALVSAAADKAMGSKEPYWTAYRRERDASRAAYKAAEARSPKSYVGGEIAGGLASMLIPGAAEGGALRAIGTAGAMGGAAALGGSEADLTKGDYGNAALDTLTGVGMGAGVGAGAAAIPAGIVAVRRIPGALRDRLDKSKVIGSLTKFVNGIIKKDGDPEVLRKAAGKLIDESVKEAGDMPVATDKFRALADEISKSSQNPYTSKLDPMSEEIVTAAERMAAKGNTTLGELNNGISYWGDKAATARKAKDLVGERMALRAKAAIEDQLAEATGNETLVAAAQKLRQGRSDYAFAKGRQGLQDVVAGASDSLSQDNSLLSPKAFANANSAKKMPDIARKFGDDAEGFKRWKMAANAARMLAQRGDSWLPPVFPPAAQTAMRNFMTNRRAMLVFSDPEAHAAFMRLMSPGRSPAPEKAAAMVGQLFARVKQLESDAETPPGSFDLNPANLQASRFPPETYTGQQ
jgi:hypothetical protein